MLWFYVGLFGQLNWFVEDFLRQSKTKNLLQDAQHNDLVLGCSFDRKFDEVSKVLWVTKLLNNLVALFACFTECD